MWFSIDFSSHIPIYRQIAEKIKLMIIQGELKKGDFVPSIRNLAGDIGVNLNTVSRAYRELVREGVLRSIRGEGYIVNAESFESFEFSIIKELEEILKKCKQAGITYEEVLSLVSKYYGRDLDDSSG
ncbi:GntR family transcriptional regulator [Thermosipho ferrireducens]|uniref:GntR family transcriptional regulator n=1 Tax=Thermosipho ferrireducens TaxID=2571116 RepID=A0ABX7S4B0_9BACT|nr:GntR family transcriptional regulator [Thermosipho ferrireducens]QTA37271.1 GntR family transcriptional regulator [Thermosipho ferrireducens]